jgi:hypothetical protein
MQHLLEKSNPIFMNNFSNSMQNYKYVYKREINLKFFQKKQISLGIKN